MTSFLTDVLITAGTRVMHILHMRFLVHAHTVYIAARRTAREIQISNASPAFRFEF